MNVPDEPSGSARIVAVSALLDVVGSIPFFGVLDLSRAIGGTAMSPTLRLAPK